MNTVTRIALIAPLALGIGITAVGARELRMGPGVPPSAETYEPYRYLHEHLPEATGGALTTRDIGVEVVNLSNSIDSLQSGIIDAAHVLTLYSPADFPNAVFVSELAGFGENGQVMAAAVTEYMLNCPECLSELGDLGLVYTGHVATPTYHILSTSPVVAPEDLSGLRLRSGGSPFSRWATAMGAVPVQMSSNDQYEAISNGLLDGTLNPDSSLVGYRLGEVVRYVTDLPIGTFHAAMPFPMRAQTWAELTPEQRREFVRVASVAEASYHPLAVADGAQAVIDAGAEYGLEVVTPSAELLAAHEAFLESELETVAQIGRERYGIADPEDRIAYFLSLVEKWTAYFDEHGHDAETVGTAIYDQLWANIDFATFGQ
ncbi:C4-dicarboxylate TRAP transporter substrate-binding protein [Rhodobacter sp. NTK016B]|uniref:C4-dicarboxylate TRAP transporter substrate-binding protein n=1 Tax=Rhodobacter sp. NTK016B TaxID=2759676 RepID=UPI001A8FAC18|nr:C4-dicarboxylate TRAP transporter substrate-binding protein [Rhodobacter sp. NTK016B]MBN8292452.1 C4-dicarboxylate TRAP transporter substrate-binding protein [Rhodobacter sp. NTK016B]